MGDRLTWDEIAEKYKNQWVGLTGVEYEEDNFNIKSAIVKYSDLDKNTLLRKQLIENEDIVAISTFM